MKRTDWIICERSGHWAAAVRLAITRASWPKPTVPRIFELRSLSELSVQLEERSRILALVEICQANVADVLRLLASAGRLHPQARFAVMVDRDLAPIVDEKQLTDVLREAGAQDVLTSSRQLAGILAIGRRFAELPAHGNNSVAPDMAITARAWSSLPWQDE